MIRVALPIFGTSALAVAALVFALVLRQTVDPAALVDVLAAETETGGAIDTMMGETAPLLPRPRDDRYYAAVTERPLFAPDRRPARAAAVPPSAADPPPAPPSLQQQPAPQIRVLGVIGASDASAALASVDGADALWLRQGEAVSGWEVLSIGPDWIEIQRGDRVVRVEMFPK